MAYMSQEKKKAIHANLKPVLAKYGVKATLAVNHHSTLVLNITEGAVDFFGCLSREKFSEERLAAIAKDGALSLNPYYWEEWFTGKALEFFAEVMPVLNEGNHDRSDIMTDYFDVGWYVAVNVGRYRKPYVLATAAASSPPTAPAAAALEAAPPKLGRLYRAARRGAATRKAAKVKMERVIVGGYVDNRSGEVVQVEERRPAGPVPTPGHGWCVMCQRVHEYGNHAPPADPAKAAELCACGHARGKHVLGGPGPCQVWNEHNEACRCLFYRPPKPSFRSYVERRETEETLRRDAENTLTIPPALFLMRGAAA